MEKTTLQQQRRRRFLLTAPLLVLPFMTLLFWTLGGGRADAENGLAVRNKGFNNQLPEARLKDEHGLSKLGYYDRAAADSAKLRQAQQADPYAQKQPAVTDTSLTGLSFAAHTGGLNTSTGGTNENPAVKAALVNQRIAQLQAVINKPPAQPAAIMAENPGSAKAVTTTPPPATAEDPELRQMSGLLEKILDIQHPERLKEKNEHSNTAAATERFQAIPAIVDGNQKIVQGTVIRMRLLDSMVVNGQTFPKGQLIYGSGDLYNQRVKIHIQLIHMGLQIIPVDLTVYDRTDGLEGISVPEAVTGDALRDGAVSGVQNMDIMSVDPSMGAQLATAGINTAKGLFSKKAKRVKGKLKNGHELLLRDNKPQTVPFSN